MDIAALFGLLHVAVVGCTVAALYRATLTQRRAVRLGRYVVVACLCSAVIAGVGYGITERVHRWRHPSDDWYDIVAFFSLVLNLCVVPVAGIIVMAIGRAFERTRRAKYASCCDTCGYDLRGSPGTRCPECGHETDKPTPNPNTEHR